MRAGLFSLRIVDIKCCPDGGVCRNEDTIEDLIDALSLAVVALRQYAAGKTWRHIAVDTLAEWEGRGLLEEAI